MGAKLKTFSIRTFTASA